MDRIWLVIATLCFLLGPAITLAFLKAGRAHPRILNRVTIAVGFVFQMVFLYQRGRAIGQCPLTNLFEVLIFLSCSITLFYFLIGHSYRLSLLGGFTGPLVAALQIVALTAVPDTRTAGFLPHSAGAEWHAALCIMAYAAFALAGVAGVMFLAQERRLKQRRIGPGFYEMPPIKALATVNVRLLWTGAALLSAGLLSAVALHPQVSARVWTWGTTLWLVYVLLPLAHRWGPRRLALLSAAAFLVSVAALCLVGHISAGGAAL